MRAPLLQESSGTHSTITVTYLSLSIYIDIDREERRRSVKKKKTEPFCTPSFVSFNRRVQLNNREQAQTVGQRQR